MVIVDWGVVKTDYARIKWESPIKLKGHGADVAEVNDAVRSGARQGA